MKLNINFGSWFSGAPKRFKTLDTELLARYCVMNKDHEILVGIHEDFSCTADVVWKDGRMVRGASPHISSNWGTPVIYDADRDAFIPCWKRTFGMAQWREA